MKNLKKVLSLVLALAMALSLMTVAFAADANDFADYDKVEHNEAVDVMVATGVFNGVEGNKFAPQDTLTREMAAKIITYMIMGQKEADKLTTTVAPYADVAASRWSAGAIAWCTEQGILAGSNGKFNPTGKLTGLAFAKMCLTALGYDAEIEKLVGSSWAINAATLAIQNDLDDGMEKVSLSSNLTREQAAQMALNTMKADMVAYANKGTNITLSDGTNVVIGATPAAAIASNIDTISDNGYLQFAEKYFEKLVMKTNNKGDDYMRPATEWEFDGDKIGAYTNDDAVAVYTEGFDADELKDLKDDYTFNDTKIWVNGVDQTTEIGGVDNLAAREYKGTVVELYDADEDDNIETIVLVQAYVAQVTDKDEESITLDIYNPWINSSTAAGDKESVVYEDNTKKDDDTYDKLAAAYDKDDYLLIYTKGAAVSEKVIEFADAEVVTGKVSTAKIENASTSYDGYFTIGSTKYTLASGYNETAINPGDEYNFFLDANGYVLGAEVVKEAVASLSEIYYAANVWENKEQKYGTEVTTYHAQLVDMSGAVTEVELEKAYADLEKQLVVTSDKKWTDTDGKKYEANNDKLDLKAWVNDDFDSNKVANYAGWKFTKDMTRFALSDGTVYRFNSSTNYVLIEKSGSDLKATVKTGGIALNGTAAMSGYIITEDGKPTAKYVIIADAANDIDETNTFNPDDLIYISAASSEKGDGYRVQEVYKADGKMTTMNVDESEYSALSAGFYAYDTNEDGYYVLSEDVKTLTISDSKNVWKDEEGVLTGKKYVGMYEDLLSVEGAVDIDVANAAFADVHDTDAAGQYDKTVSSLSALKNLVDNDKYTTTATLALNVSEDGAVTVFVTSLTRVAK